MRKGLTLLELLIVLAIILILVGLVVPFTSNSTVSGEIVNKWSDIDANRNRIYLVSVRTGDQVDTWNAYWVYDQVHVGHIYRFTTFGTYLRDAELISRAIER